MVDSHGCFVACDFWLSSLDAFILFGTAFTGIFAVSFYFMLCWSSLTISSRLSGRKPTADRHKADDIRHINHLHDLEVSSRLGGRQSSSGVLYKPLWVHGVLRGLVWGAIWGQFWGS